MAIDKDDGDNIRNDTRAPFAWEGLDRIGRDSEYGTAFPRTCGEKTKSFAVISSHGNEGCRGSLSRPEVGGLASHTLERFLGVVHCGPFCPYGPRGLAVVRWERRAVGVQSSPRGASELPRRSDGGHDYVVHGFRDDLASGMGTFRRAPTSVPQGRRRLRLTRLHASAPRHPH